MISSTEHTVRTAPALAEPRPIFSITRLIAWLVAKDAEYRHAKMLEDLPPELLHDVGLEATSTGLRRTF